MVVKTHTFERFWGFLGIDGYIVVHYFYPDSAAAVCNCRVLLWCQQQRRQQEFSTSAAVGNRCFSRYDVSRGYAKWVPGTLLGQDLEGWTSVVEFS